MTKKQDVFEEFVNENKEKLAVKFLGDTTDNALNFIAYLKEKELINNNMIIGFCERETGNKFKEFIENEFADECSRLEDISFMALDEQEYGKIK